MSSSSINRALTEGELTRLGDFLKTCNGAMTIEEVDGFFAALIAGPEVVLPSEYLPSVFGRDVPKMCEFAGLDEANEILGLLMRHWNVIAVTLNKGDVYVPMLLEDDNGLCRGNDWASGFMRGVEMRRADWAQLIVDEEYGGCMVPVMMLHHEHDPDPELRPGAISPEMRDEVIVQMAAGIVRAYRYSRANRRAATPDHVEPHGTPGKLGRNAPCPCGSGKKYKRCCGNVTIN